jgi:hypothetical protein
MRAVTDNVAFSTQDRILGHDSIQGSNAKGNIDRRGHTNTAVLKTKWRLEVEPPPEAELTYRHSLRYNSGRGNMTLTLQPPS